MQKARGGSIYPPRAIFHIINFPVAPRRHCGLKAQQERLDFEAAAKADKFAVRAYDAVAWDYYRYGVAVVRKPRGTEALRRAGGARYVRVGRGHAVGDLQQRLPAAELEGRALRS